MSKLHVARTGKQSIGVIDGRRSNPSSALHSVTKMAFPKHVLWLHPTQQLNFGSISLTEELDNFMEYVQLDGKEERCRSYILAALDNVINQLFTGAEISLFGSYPIGLATFISDLDVTLLFSNGIRQMNRQDDTHSSSEECGISGNVLDERHAGIMNWHDPQRKGMALTNPDGDNNHNEMECYNGVMTSYDREELRVQNAFRLESLYETLKSESWVQRVEHRPRARVPIINFTHRSGVECDISIDMPLQSTLHVVRALLQRCGPALSKLSAFLKIYLNQLGLDAPFTGGLGSYKLYILLAKRIEQQPAEMQLGDRLIDFLGYYCQPEHLNEHTVVEVVNAEAASFERTSQVQEIQSAFAIAHRVLCEAARDAANPHLAKKKYIGCTQASCSALAGLLDTELLYQERMRRRIQCHLFVASNAVAVPIQSGPNSHTEEVVDLALTDNDHQDTENGAQENSNQDREMLPSNTSSESLADLHKQLDTLKSRLMEKRLTAAAQQGPSSPQNQNSSSSASPPAVVTSGSVYADPRLVFTPTDSMGKRIVAGADPLPVHMIVPEDKKLFLPSETQQRLGPFRSLHIGERYTQKSLEELESLQYQHTVQVARLEAALSHAPPMSSSLLVFSPLTDYGKLILAGALPVPPQMKITLQQKQRIEEEQHCREGIAKLIELKRRPRNRSNSRSSSFSEEESYSASAQHPKTSADNERNYVLNSSNTFAADENTCISFQKCDDTISIESFSDCDVNFERSEHWEDCSEPLQEEMRTFEVTAVVDATSSDSEECIVEWVIDRVPAVSESSLAAASAAPSVIPVPANQASLSPSARTRSPTVESRNVLSPPVVPEVCLMLSTSTVSAVEHSTQRDCDDMNKQSIKADPVADINEAGPSSPFRDVLVPQKQDNFSPCATAAITSDQLHDISNDAVKSANEGSASKPHSKRPPSPVLRFGQGRPLGRKTKYIDTMLSSPLLSVANQSTLDEMTPHESKRRCERDHTPMMDNYARLSNCVDSSHSVSDHAVESASSPVAASGLSAKTNVGASVAPETVPKHAPVGVCTVVSRSATPQEDLATAGEFGVTAIASNAAPDCTAAATASSTATVCSNPMQLASKSAHEASINSNKSAFVTTFSKVQAALHTATTTATEAGVRKIAKKTTVPAELLTNITTANPLTTVSATTSTAATNSTPTTTAIAIATTNTAFEPRRVRQRVHSNTHRAYIPATPYASSFTCINSTTTVVMHSDIAFPAPPFQTAHGFAPVPNVNTLQYPVGGIYMPPAAQPIIPVPYPPPLQAPLQAPLPQSYQQFYHPQFNPMLPPLGQAFAQTPPYPQQLMHHQEHMWHQDPYQHHYNAPSMCPSPVPFAAPYSGFNYGMEVNRSSPPPLPPYPPAPDLFVPQNEHQQHSAQLEAHSDYASLPDDPGLSQQYTHNHYPAQSSREHVDVGYVGHHGDNYLHHNCEEQHQPQQELPYYDIHAYSHTTSTDPHNNTHSLSDTSWTQDHSVYSHYDGHTTHYIPIPPPQPPAPG